MRRSFTFFQQAMNLSSSRTLHSPLFFYPKRTQELVIIGNNSMVFGALDSLNHFGINNYPKLTFIYPPFWLDKLHPDYRNLDWGQTIYGLPRSVREIFHQVRPNYPDDQFVKWGDFQDVRAEALQRLKSLIPAVYEGNPVSIEHLTNKDWQIRLEDRTTILTPENTYFYGWYRKPFLPPSIPNAHNKLYTLPRDSIPSSIILLGHGLSLVWLLKHFPDLVIHNIKRPHETLPIIPSNMDIEPEKEVQRGRLKIYTTDDAQLEVYKSGVRGNIRNSKNDALLLEDTPVFAATGLVPNNALFTQVLKENKILMPRFDEQGNLIEPEDIQSKNLATNKFVSTKNTPRGSLPDSYIYLMTLTQNLGWTAEPMFFYDKSQFQLIKEKLKENGIDLPVTYFNAVEKEIADLADPSDFQSNLLIYMRNFEKLCSPSAIEISAFSRSLQEIFKGDAMDLEPRNTLK